MAKNDKLKEEIAESRHGEIIIIILGTFAFAGIALIIASATWVLGTSDTAGWPEVAFLLLSSLYVAFLVCMVVIYVRRNKRERMKKIEQLGNAGKKPGADNSTKEPTRKDILKEIERSRITMWLTPTAFGGSVGLLGASLNAPGTNAWGISIGATGIAFMVFCLLGALKARRRFKAKWGS